MKEKIIELYGLIQTSEGPGPFDNSGIYTIKEYPEFGIIPDYYNGKKEYYFFVFLRSNKKNLLCDAVPQEFALKHKDEVMNAIKVSYEKYVKK